MESSTLPTSGVSPPEERIDVDKLVESFVLLRDRKRAMEKQHKDALAPFNQVMDEISGKLLAHLDKIGASSITTPSGNAHKLTKQSATIKDGAAFREFVINNEEFDLVDWRANAKAVFEYIGDHKGAPPPGVNPSSFTTVGIRRPTDKAED
jgi:hypothetical protein